MNKAVDKIRYRGKKIPVYVDDYGQCYYFLYNGKSYSCGTYNSDYIGEIVSVVDEDLDESFYVQPIRDHRPSAKAYKRYGVWYCDYHGYEGLLLSYGDLLKKDKRPTREYLIQRAKDIMSLIDDKDEKSANDNVQPASRDA